MTKDERKAARDRCEQWSRKSTISDTHYELEMERMLGTMACTDLPAALGHIDELEAENTRLRGMLDGMSTYAADWKPRHSFEESRVTEHRALLRDYADTKEKNQ